MLSDSHTHVNRLRMQLMQCLFVGLISAANTTFLCAELRFDPQRPNFQPVHHCWILRREQEEGVWVYCKPATLSQAV